MGRVSDNTKEIIRSRIDMVQLVSEYVTLERKSPGDFWGRCPFHDEKSASFHVLQNRGIFKCFGCGKGGDVFSFVEEIEGIKFGEALQRLAEKAGVEIKERSPQERAQDERRAELRRASELVGGFFRTVLWSNTPAGEKGRAYLQERGIDKETADAFGLGMAPEEWGAVRNFARERGLDQGVLIELGLLRESRDGRQPYDFFRDRLMFPIRDEQGKVIAFGGRTLSGDERKYMNSKELAGFYEKRKVLYGLDLARKSNSKRLVVVEGYLDVIMPHQFGRTEFVATLGTAFTEEQARLARRYVDEVVLLFDGDEAGTNAMLRALAKLVGVKALTIRVATLPEGMDPDDAVRKDPAILDKALEEADDLIGFLVEQSLKGYDRSTPVAQERAIKAAIKLLGRIDENIRLFRELGAIAARFGIPEQVLRDEVSKVELQERESVLRKQGRPPTGRGGQPGRRRGGYDKGQRGGFGQAQRSQRPAPQPHFEPGPYGPDIDYDGPPPGYGEYGEPLDGSPGGGHDMGPPASMRQPVRSAPVHPSELYLLEALLGLPDGASGVVAQGAGAQLFTPGPSQRVASAIFEQAAGGPVEPAQVMGRLEDPAARALCGRLIGRIDADKDYAREVEGWSTLRQRLVRRRRNELLRQIRAAGDDETRRQLLEQHKQLRDEPA